MDEFYELNWDGSTSSVIPDMTPPKPLPPNDVDLFDSNWDGSTQ